MRKLCWWAGACAGAIFLAVYLLPEGAYVPAGILCALGALLSLLFQGKARKRAALAALGLAAGFLWTGCYALLFRTPAHALVTGETAEYTLTVADFPAETSRGAAFSARLSLPGRPDPKVQVYIREDGLDLLPGDVISLSLRLSRSDFSRGESVDYYQSKGIYLLGSAWDGYTLLERPASPPFSLWPRYAARALKDSVARSFPEDVSGFAAALLTGDKSRLPTGLYTAFQRAGVAHVVAVSGLHISFLAGLLAALLGKRKRRTIAATLVLIFFFAALAGNSPSALRSAFMWGIMALAPLVDREEDRPTTLAAALVLLLLPCPYAAASVSLQLSFAAAAGISFLSGPLSSRWLGAIPKWTSFPGRLCRKVLLFCAATLAVTLGALLFTTPLAAVHFRSVSLLGPIANLLTLWAVSDVFLGGLLTALLGLFLPGPARMFGRVLAWPARWVLFAARTVSKLPFASLSLLSGYLAGWFALAYGILLLWLFAKPRMRPAFPIAAILLTLCPALLANAWPAVTGELTVAALDVGQGASTLFYSKGSAVLVDCGGTGADDPGDVCADYLQSLGSSHLDALILTHYHTDHADGAPELLERLDISLLIAPALGTEDPSQAELLALAEAHGCEVLLLSEDASVQFGGASLQIYAPLGDGGANEEGLSVLCSAGDFDVLVTGDMNDVVERRLVKYKDLPDIELLVVGHHGSKNAASEELLLAVRPEIAVISCGYNTYGHPALETLERLGAAGCGIYRTDLMGTVTFTVKGE